MTGVSHRIYVYIWLVLINIFVIYRLLFAEIQLHLNGKVKNNSLYFLWHLIYRAKR